MDKQFEAVIATAPEYLQTTDSTVELSEVQLALIGGGIGDTVL